MRRAVAVGLGLSGLLACGDPAVPTTADPGLTTVNGARHPVVSPGELAGWSGFGFGAEQGTGVLLVTTAAGLTATPVIEWSDVGILARLPGDLVSGPTWVVSAGDSLGPVPLTVRPAAVFTPGVRVWAEAAALPEARAAAGAAALLYPGDAGVTAVAVLFGGARADSALSDATHLGQVDQNGRITSWAAAPDTVIPASRRDHAMAGGDPSNSRITRLNGGGEAEAVAYLIGGRDAGGGVLATVHGLAVSATGGYGLWSPLTPLPGARAGATAIVAFGNLIVIGGYGPDSLALPDVSVAAIADDGTLNGWFDGPRLPEGLAYASVALQGQTLYLTGGERGLIAPGGVADTAALTGTVVMIRLSPRSGSFLDSAWTAAPSLIHPRSRHAAFVLDDALVVTGGVYAGVPGAGESEFAPVAADGTLGAFAELPPPTIATLAGTPVWSAATPRLMARDGTWRASLLGGATTAGAGARTWTQ
jgi:hypothetical protein